MSHWSGRNRSRRYASLIGLLGLLTGFGVVAAQPVRAAEQCAQQKALFAVVAATGHLVEVAGCESEPAIGAAVEVDAGEWRNYLHVFAARDATTVVLYTVTELGVLSSRRQNGPGAAFGPPVRIAPSIDWSQFKTVLAGPSGYLYAVEHLGPVRTFRHPNWSAGGTRLFEELPLLSRAIKPSTMIAVHWGGPAEAVDEHLHYRIWDNPNYPEFVDHDDWRKDSGSLPPNLTGVVGSEPWLYGMDAAGDLVQLYQVPNDDGEDRCGNIAHWNIVSRLSGGYARVVVPTVPTPVPPGGRRLGFVIAGEMCPSPLEWQ
jgi:hypothetical protein